MSNFIVAAANKQIGVGKPVKQIILNLREIKHIYVAVYHTRYMIGVSMQKPKFILLGCYQIKRNMEKDKVTSESAVSIYSLFGNI